MEYVEQIRSSIGDAFFALPLLLTGFLFFIGTLTSNIGYLYLFLGHLIIVPALNYLSNQPVVDKFTTGISSLSMIIVFCLIFLGYADLKTPDQYRWLIILSGVIPIIQYLVFVKTDKSEDYKVPAFTYINPFTYLPGVNVTANTECPIYPGQGTKANYNNPSLWFTHIAFLKGFLMANAIAVLNQPSPDLKKTGDSKIDKPRQARADLRVRNRKWLCWCIIGIISFMVIFLLYFRNLTTNCENKSLMGFYSFPIIILIGSIGGAFFNLLSNTCGIHSIDSLGIVQGMIDPDLIDKPIICVGS